MRIWNTEIGDGHPAYIVAEIGINHDNEYECALRLIEMAARSGADAVKFQFFRMERMYNRAAGTYKTAAGRRVPICNLIRDNELPEAWLDQLIDVAHRQGLAFICTVCDEAGADVLFNHGIDAFKIASYEISHIPLLEKVGRFRIPVIVSSGGANLSDIEEAINALSPLSSEQTALMHCVAKYPVPLEFANVAAVKTLAGAFPGIVIGYSDHTEDPVIAPVHAVASGARMIEKHVTLDKNRTGADHCFALNEKQLTEMVYGVRRAEKDIARNRRVRLSDEVLGSGRRQVQDIERALRSFAYRSIFSTERIRKGTPLTPRNIAVLRAGVQKPGLHPRYYRMLVDDQARATRDIQASRGIQWGDLLALKKPSRERPWALTKTDPPLLIRTDPPTLK